MTSLMQRAGAAGLLILTLTLLAACGGGGGGSSAAVQSGVPAAPVAPVAPVVLNNSAPLLIDNTIAANGNSINVPFVSVTVCRPGTSVCQTVDHILLDTGSEGLRLMAPYATSLALPALKTASGANAGECGKFATGYTWGPLFQADVKIAGETASAIPIQVIDDSGASFPVAPSACSSAGASLGSLAALGANGILGVGLFRQDCGNACVRSASSGVYYACASGGCSGTTMALAQQLGNPVASFASDNNGILVLLPAVGVGGATTLTGSLIFGIATQDNNALSGAVRYRANTSGNFTTTYKGKAYTASFIDTGSNGYFFSDSSIATCRVSTAFYCPTRTLDLSAVTAAYDGSASSTISFSIVSIDGLARSTSAGLVGGTIDSPDSTLSGVNAFDWGLPFFYGRRVFVGIEDAGGGGAYWAY